MALTILLLALGGCAGMGAEECRTADWRAIGHEDGVQGQSAAYFGTRRKACARPQNGYHLGVHGHPYAGVCLAELEPSFLAAHADGYGLYERAATLDRIRKRLHHSRERARRIEHLLAESTALLMAPDLVATERATVVVEIKQLSEERIHLARSIDQLEHDHAAAELDYEDFRRHVAGQYGG
ncbi:MAG: hypothetical protein K0S35_1594 [Geminicoccaceae bacterium]|nr:hypothetical protein [Geminicoccaceae bacterium]